MANEQAQKEELSFWAIVTVSNRVTIPPTICKIAGIDDNKIVRLRVETVKDREA